MAEKKPVLYMAIYIGPEDGATNITNDPFLFKEDSIESAMYTSREMAIAKGEHVLRTDQKIVLKRYVVYDSDRFDVTIDEGDIITLYNERMEILEEKAIITDVEINIVPDRLFEMKMACETYKNIPRNFGRTIAIYNE